MGQIIILIFVILFILNWVRLRKGESVNRLYEKLHIEPVFIGKYMDEYDSVSCLLYTSPSPRDLSTSRMPSSA